MSDILAKLQAVHDKRALHKVHVPEYGMDLYFPPFTVADRDAARRGVNPKDESALMVSALVHMARDKDGSKMFDGPPEQMVKIKAELHRMEYNVLMRIMLEAGGGLSEAISAELAELDVEAVSAALATVVGEGTALAAMIAAAPDAAVLSGIQNLAETMAGAEQSQKNA